MNAMNMFENADQISRNLSGRPPSKSAQLPYKARNRYVQELSRPNNIPTLLSLLFVHLLQKMA